MDFEELVNSRRSVRGFKDQPVPRAVIEDILAVAKRAPSSMNTQPWHVHVLTGEPLEQLRRRNMEEMVAGAKAKRDIVSHGEYQGIHRKRQVDIAKQLFAVMGPSAGHAGPAFRSPCRTGAAAPAQRCPASASICPSR